MAAAATKQTGPKCVLPWLNGIGAGAIPRLSWTAQTPMPAFDYQTRFRRAPVGMVMSRERVVLDVNEEAARIFGHPCGAIIGQSFEMLYPSQGDFERMGARIAPNVRGSYSDEHITADVVARRYGLVRIVIDS